MVDLMFAACSCRLVKVDAERLGQCADLGGGTGNTGKPLAEVRQVTCQRFRRVPLRIDAYQYDFREVICATAQHAIAGHRQLLKCCRANIRTVGKSEKHQTPLTAQRFVGKACTVLVEQAECGQWCRIPQQCRPLQHRRWRLQGEAEENGAATDRNQDENDRQDFARHVHCWSYINEWR